MAEQYEPGTQKIFYRAWKFATGLTVTVQLIHFIGLDINKGDVISLYEVDVSQFPGLYCFDYPFLVGNYVAYFYENGIPSISQAYNIKETGQQLSQSGVDIIVGAIDTSLDAKLEELKANIEFIKQIEGGRWKIVNNQMIFYEDTNGTEVARFDLFDSSGKPTTIDVTERRRV